MADATMLGTVLTAGGAIAAGGVTGWLTARIKARQDLDSWTRARSGMVDENAATLLRDTVTAIAGVGHAGCWLTWKAACDAAALTNADVQSYDAKVHELMPRIMGGQAAIGAYCPSTARKVKQAVNAILAEDAEIGMACIAFRNGDTAPLAARHQSAQRAYESALDVCEGLGAELLAGRSHRA